MVCSEELSKFPYMKRLKRNFSSNVFRRSIRGRKGFSSDFFWLYLHLEVAYLMLFRPGTWQKYNSKVIAWVIYTLSQKIGDEVYTTTKRTYTFGAFWWLNEWLSHFPTGLSMKLFSKLICPLNNYKSCFKLPLPVLSKFSSFLLAKLMRSQMAKFWCAFWSFNTCLTSHLFSVSPVSLFFHMFLPYSLLCLPGMETIFFPSETKKRMYIHKNVFTKLGLVN